METITTRFASLTDAVTVPDGGFTVEPATGRDVTGGYAVSVHPECERVIATPSEADLATYVIDHAPTLSQPGRRFGGWHDPDTGLVHLDVSLVVESLDEALALARDNNQLAVFDLTMLASISVRVPSAV